MSLSNFCKSLWKRHQRTSWARRAVRQRFLHATPWSAPQFARYLRVENLEPRTLLACDIVATKEDALASGGDLDGDGVVDPGDIIEYTVVVDNSAGTSNCTNVQFSDTPDSRTTLAGSTPFTMNIGTLPAGSSTTFQFQVTVNDLTNGFAPILSNQGSVTHDGSATVVLTDDPSISGSSDPTTTTLDSLTLGDEVFYDGNANGTRDFFDFGIDGVLLNLFVDDGDGVLDAGDGSAIATTTTASGGIYSFSGLLPGSYIVQVDASNFGAGQSLENRISYFGSTNPDNNIDDDDNGVDDSLPATNGIASEAITLDYNTEPTLGTGNDTNSTLDFAFVDDVDLTATKTNNVGGTTSPGVGWIWNIRIANDGNAPATFGVETTVLIDNLPETDITYSTATVSPNTTPVVCNIDIFFDLFCFAANDFDLAPGTFFDVFFTATPSAVTSYTNPRSTGPEDDCRVDPGNGVGEFNESNNQCSDTVIVEDHDLTVVKTNDVSGTVDLGDSWNWNLEIANSGFTAASFAQGDVVLFDALPDTNVSYGSVSVTPNTTNVVCSIDGSQNLSCVAGPGGLTLPISTSFDVLFSATPTAGGTYDNPRSGSATDCTVDPNDVSAENDEANNSCSDSVTVNVPDLVATKSNNVSGVRPLGGSWTWTIRVDNSGTDEASFAAGATVLIDNLPDTNISYGAVTVSPNTTNMSCGIDGSENLICTAGAGGLTIPASGFFTVSFPATPSAIGNYNNPRSGVNQCAADPNNNVTESSEANNACSDAVNVIAPDLTATKTNNVSGATTLGGSWTWNVQVANNGNYAANLAQGAILLIDNLPNTNINYGSVTVTPNTTNVNCNIDGSQNLSCTVGAGGLTIPAGTGSFDVSFTATPTAIGTFSNPRSGASNQCRVDPPGSVKESDKTNNTCSDSVTVTAPDLTATKSNNVNGVRPLGGSWTWNVNLANSGPAAAIFGPGDTVFIDNLPETNISYGAVTVSPVSSMSCLIDGSDNLICIAGASGLTIPASGSINISFAATPTAIGTYSNPRTGASNECEVDPNNDVSETNDNNNSCSDSVTVIAPDLTVAKTNDVGGATTLGNTWTWNLHVENQGTYQANFAQGANLLIDNLPNTNINYGAVSVSPNTTNVSCSIDGSQNLSCVTGAGGLSIPVGGSFDVFFTATPTDVGTFSNPRSGRGTQCTVDPPGSLKESDKSNNTCSDSVTVTAPDLTATKSNNVGGVRPLGGSWTWAIRIGNSGNGGASFAAGETVLTDNLPDTNISYGAISVSPNSSNINCSIDGSDNLNCVAGAGGLTIPAAGFIDVSFAATPGAIGSYSNPRSGGSNQCAADPNNTAIETDEGNNSCSDSVTVIAPDLTVTKSNNVSGNTTLGNSWTWNLRVENQGVYVANFAQGATLLIDNLPDTNINYGSVTVSPNTTNVNCSIDGNKNLSCMVGAGGLSVPISGFFDVFFTATPTSTGVFNNPRSGGANQCKVDPAGALKESDKTNNTCSDGVAVNAPDLTAVKTNNVSGVRPLGGSWTWNVRVSNFGLAVASFGSGAEVLIDNLPDTGMSYGAVTVSPNSTNVSCSINGSDDLICMAGVGGLDVGVGGFFDVSFAATPSAIGTYDNPRSSGSFQCAADPDNVILESDEANNSCSDSVTVIAPDLTVTKTNNVGGATTLGNSWTWNLQVENQGSYVANFAQGATLLIDNLPTIDIGYGSVTVSPNTTNVNCSINASENLSCVVGTGGLSIPVGGTFDVFFTATPTNTGTFTNPRAGGPNQCTVDPPGSLKESDRSNNTCSDSVTVTAPDLVTTKTNNNGGFQQLGGSWFWSVRVANAGSDASFATGATVLIDNLPDSNLNYTSLFVSPNTTNVNCSIDGNKNLLCTAGVGGFNLPSGSFFDVVFLVTPAAIGTYTNPRSGGTNQCKSDPDNTVFESNESNNGCTDTVTVIAPDLTAVKTNDVAGVTTLGGSWTWTIRVANNGDNAVLGDSTTVLIDNLPDTGISYSAVSVSPPTNVNCAIDANANLICKAGAGNLTMPPSSFFDVSFTATPTTFGTFTNPRSGGSNQCKVDPNSLTTESNENNNTCSDSVAVTGLDLIATKTNNSGGSATLGDSWTWSVEVANSGNLAASFAAGATVLVDNLPDTSISYGAVTVLPNTTNVICSIDANSDLTCVAGPGGLTLAANTSFVASFDATATAIGTYSNPRSGTANKCQVDPNNAVSETDENNNSCSDAVNVIVCGPYITNTTLKVGRNRIRVINGTPGNIIAFYVGSQTGDYYVARYGVTIDIADPLKFAQSVVASNGVTIAYLYIPPSLAGRTLLVQGFEKFPPKCVTNLVVATVGLYAEGGEGPGAEPLSAADVPAILDEAKQRWTDLGLNDEQQQRLNAADFEITDLPEGQLGAVAGTAVFLDLTAAGHGWYVDTRPEDDSEFQLNGSVLQGSGDITTKMDLMTVVMHELGHVIGLVHTGHDAHGLLDETLAAGERRLPDASLAEEANQFEFDSAIAELIGEAGYAMDVNGDGWVTPLDGLKVINDLNQFGSRAVNGNAEVDVLDVDGDGWSSPMDALQVINDLNSQGGRAIPQADLNASLLASSGGDAGSSDAEGEPSPEAEASDAAPFYPVPPSVTSLFSVDTEPRSSNSVDCDEELLDLIAADLGRPGGSL